MLSLGIAWNMPLSKCVCEENTSDKRHFHFSGLSKLKKTARNLGVLVFFFNFNNCKNVFNFV